VAGFAFSGAAAAHGPRPTSPSETRLVFKRGAVVPAVTYRLPFLPTYRRAVSPGTATSLLQGPRPGRVRVRRTGSAWRTISRTPPVEPSRPIPGCVTCTRLRRRPHLPLGRRWERPGARSLKAWPQRSHSSALSGWMRRHLGHSMPARFLARRAGDSRKSRARRVSAALPRSIWGSGAHGPSGAWGGAPKTKDL